MPAYQGKGCYPKVGKLIRPLQRKYQENVIAASSPERQCHFFHDGRRIDVHAWHNLVRSTTLVAVDAPTFVIYVFHHPLYKQLLVLATNLAQISAEAVYHIYRDRWPVEQPPLAAKQMVSLHRHFVFADEACFRLPELSLITGAILTYTAAVLPPIPAGFWDRSPKATLVQKQGSISVSRPRFLPPVGMTKPSTWSATALGRLRRLLQQVDFSTLTIIDPQIRKKELGDGSLIQRD
ncbi:MAG: hypothetical protein IPM07_11035 [Anaerolineales bacterium]|nr:hypothetical protein [Anaerolineales bacterium]